MIYANITSHCKGFSKAEGATIKQWQNPFPQVCGFQVSRLQVWDLEPANLKPANLQICKTASLQS